MSSLHQPKNHAKLIFLLLFMVVCVTFAVIYFGIFKDSFLLSHAKEIKINGTFLPSAKTIEDFQLTDNKGNPFTKKNLKGKWTMLFFGFTNCGYVCPTTLTELNEMIKILQKEGTAYPLPQIVLVSVDPERDSISRINDYINAFNPTFIGVRAPLDVTEDLEKKLHIAAIKMEANNKEKDHYTVNHSAEILLINPDATIQAYLSFPHKADQLAKDYKQTLDVTA